MKPKVNCWCIPYCGGNNCTTNFLHQLIVWRAYTVNISWNPNPKVCYTNENFWHVLWHNVGITSFLDIIKFDMDVIDSNIYTLLHIFYIHQSSLESKEACSYGLVVRIKMDIFVMHQCNLFFWWMISASLSIFIFL